MVGYRTGSTHRHADHATAQAVDAHRTLYLMANSGFGVGGIWWGVRWLRQRGRQPHAYGSGSDEFLFHLFGGKPRIIPLSSGTAGLPPKSRHPGSLPGAGSLSRNGRLPHGLYAQARRPRDRASRGRPPHASCLKQARASCAANEPNMEATERQLRCPSFRRIQTSDRGMSDTIWADLDQ